MKSLYPAVLATVLAVGLPSVALAQAGDERPASPGGGSGGGIDGRGMSPAGGAAERQRGSIDARAAAEWSAREHFQRGQRLSAAGDHAAAYRELAAGYALTERPLFLFHMAEAARAGGELDKARASYEAFLRAEPQSALSTTAKERLAALSALSASATAGPPASVSSAAPGQVEAAPSTAVAPAVPPPWAISGPPSGHRPHDADLVIAPGSDAVERAPVWRRWPFWAAVAGVVVGGVTIYAIAHDGDPCGGCGQLDFR